MRALALTLLLAAIACAPSVRIDRTSFDGPRVVGTTFVGVRGEDQLVWLERLSPRGAIVRSVSMEDASNTVLARTSGYAGDAWLMQVRADQGWRAVPSIGEPGAPSATFALEPDLALVVHAASALSTYGAARVEVTRDGQRAEVLEIVAVDGLVVGPVYVVGDAAVLVVRDGSVASLRVVDLLAAQIELDNLAALEALRVGDPQQAAALLERAVARDPRSGTSIYNLACVHARIGDLDRAEHELAIAIAIDPHRFIPLARRDDDLDALRERPSVRRRIGLEEDD